MTKYCKDMCIICFAPKRYDSQWLYAPSEENAHETCVSEIGSIFQDLIQVSLSFEEERPQFVCNYCKTKLITLHKFKLKALDAYKRVSTEIHKAELIECSSIENPLKVEEITVFDVSTKRTEKYEIQYLDEDQEDNVEVIDVDNDLYASDMPDVHSNRDQSNISSIKRPTPASLEVKCQLCSKIFASNEAFNIHWKEHEELPQYSSNMYEDLVEKRRQMGRERQRKWRERQNPEKLELIRRRNLERKKIRRLLQSEKESKTTQLVNADNLEKMQQLKTLERQRTQARCVANALQFNHESFGTKYQCNDGASEEEKEIIDIDGKFTMRFKKIPPPYGDCLKSSRETSIDENMEPSNRVKRTYLPENCDNCPQKFHSRENYLRHIGVHQGQKKLSCGVCGKIFHRLGHLQFHMKTHTDERPYECELCHKRFRSSSHLKYHLYSHGEKQFKCGICHQMYSTPRTLNEHEKYVHKRELPFSCDMCNKQFMRRHKLERHRMLHFRSNSRLNTTITKDYQKIETSTI